MGYRVVKQYVATNGLEMADDGLLEIVDPSYYIYEDLGCSAAFEFNAGLKAAQKAVQKMAPMRDKRTFTQKEVIEAIEACMDKAAKEHEPKLPTIVVQIVKED